MVRRSTGEARGDALAAIEWVEWVAQDLVAATNYVDGQKEHHREMTFQEEFRRFLHKYGVEYDERYVWD